MNVDTETVLIVSTMIFVTCMGGLGALWMMVRRLDRDIERDMDRRHP